MNTRTRSLALFSSTALAIALALGACNAHSGESGAGAEATEAAAGAQRVDGPTARQLVADGARLIDVRTPGEFESGHVDGAVNIPVDEIAGRLEEVGPTDGPVVVYCRSGNRSATAAATLIDAGFEAVYDLGSISAW